MMRNRIVTGVMMIGLIAGAIYFAHLSRESKKALHASMAESRAREGSLRNALRDTQNALRNTQEERMELERELVRRQTVLQKERIVAATFREASTKHEGLLLKLRDTISDLYKRNLLKLRENEKNLLKLRDTISDLEAQASEKDQKNANRIRALQYEKEKIALKLREETQMSRMEAVQCVTFYGSDFSRQTCRND